MSHPRLIRYWTKLANLVLLCRVHHRLVHEEGFAVGQGKEGLVFRAPDGRRVEDVPRQRVLMYDPVLTLITSQAELGITPRTTVPEWMGEAPAYDRITDALWRRDHRAEANSLRGPEAIPVHDSTSASR
jgi:hypothetical protein